MSLTYDPKDPDDTDDFTVNWSNQLSTSETVSSVSTSVTAGTVTVSSSSISSDGKKTVHRITGGADEETAEVRVRIVTSTSRQLDETISFEVAEN